MPQPTDPRQRPRLALLISGRGSNMRAIAEAVLASGLPIEISGVISSRPEAEGLAHARALGLPTQTIDAASFSCREDFDAALAAALRAQAPTLIALAGFMRILTPGFVTEFAGRLINIHPSLLPAYRGLNTHARAIADGARLHGASVHAVTPGLDEGPVLAQAEVPVLPQDTPETLSQRVLAVEHPLYVQSVMAVLAGRQRLVDGAWQSFPPHPGFESVGFSARLTASDLGLDAP